MTFSSFLLFLSDFSSYLGYQCSTDLRYVLFSSNVKYVSPLYCSMSVFCVCKLNRIRTRRRQRQKATKQKTIESFVCRLSPPLLSASFSRHHRSQSANFFALFYITSFPIWFWLGISYRVYPSRNQMWTSKQKKKTDDDFYFHFMQMEVSLLLLLCRYRAWDSPNAKRSRRA